MNSCKNKNQQENMDRKCAGNIAMKYIKTNRQTRFLLMMKLLILIIHMKHG
jgi:hypothetical protein